MIKITIKDGHREEGAAQLCAALFKSPSLEVSNSVSQNEVSCLKGSELTIADGFHMVTGHL